jgi:hypothetical protein
MTASDWEQEQALLWVDQGLARIAKLTGENAKLRAERAKVRAVLAEKLDWAESRTRALGVADMFGTFGAGNVLEMLKEIRDALEGNDDGK